MQYRRELTVIVLTYNSEKTVGVCLSSLVAQKYKDFKVLVVDDDSTDRTLDIVSEFVNRLDIEVVKNGAHNIAAGRNIGLRKSDTPFVAFVDSDDSAAPEWTDVIVRTFDGVDDIGLISGLLLPVSKTRIAKAIVMTDDAVRRIVGSEVFLFSSCNCALNRRVIPECFFDETFRHAADIELAARVGQWEYVKDMKVYHTSRESLGGYASQMYRYGSWRMWYGVRARDFRVIDFVPLVVIGGSALAAAVFKRPVWLLGIVAFSFAESVFVVCYQRLSGAVGVLVFPAWLTKNVAWSIGVLRAFAILAMNGKFRREIATYHGSPS